MIRLNNLRLPRETDFSVPAGIVARALRVPEEQIADAVLFRRSVDARDKRDVHYCCSFVFTLKGDDQELLRRVKNAELFTEKLYEWKHVQKKPEVRPVVVGFGPAGMFAALALARAGFCPLVLERGFDVDTRTADVQAFFAGGALKENSNIQFGEGGAGTFSDGKLNSGIKDGRIREVLRTFVSFGAPDSILYDAKPHIGTDILCKVVKNLREEIRSLGGEIRFGAKLTDLTLKDGVLAGITVNEKELLPCKYLILAIGHSARDTFAMLKEKQIPMCRKPFAMGVRAEHLQQNINRAMYGTDPKNNVFFPADYKLAVHLKSGRGVYTFCMCPGGEVVNASSENGGVAVNGMSNSRRDGINANSAVLVGVSPDDLPGDNVLAGCALQEKIEKAAYRAADGGVPVTTLGAFLNGNPVAFGQVKPTVLPRAVPCDFSDFLPEFIVSALREGFPLFEHKIKGFSAEDTVLTGPETRSSSPVRILRADNGVSLGVAGLYPTGEGAGYAGGIMSAAVDGLHCAEQLIDEENRG